MSMIKDHRPYWLNKLYACYEDWYSRHFTAPHFKSLGRNFTLMKPWYIDVSGGHISVGDNVHMITAKDRRISFSTWQFENYQGHISLDDNCLVCPGVRFDSGSEITVGKNCMFAAGAYITDADWHDIYDRTQSVGNTQPVQLADNVWIGDGAVICKGVTIGENSVIGAGSVVTSAIPANVIAAGNPARVVKELDPNREIVTRASLFTDPDALNFKIDQINRYVLTSNSLLNWIRTCFAPKRGD